MPWMPTRRSMSPSTRPSLRIARAACRSIFQNSARATLCCPAATAPMSTSTASGSGAKPCRSRRLKAREPRSCAWRVRRCSGSASTWTRSTGNPPKPVSQPPHRLPTAPTLPPTCRAPAAHSTPAKTAWTCRFRRSTWHARRAAMSTRASGTAASMPPLCATTPIPLRPAPTAARSAPIIWASIPGLTWAIGIGATTAATAKPTAPRVIKATPPTCSAT